MWPGAAPKEIWPAFEKRFGLKIIEGIRNEYFGEERPLSPPAKHIAVADTTYHLGNSEPGRINLVKLGHNEKSFC